MNESSIEQEKLNSLIFSPILSLFWILSSASIDAVTGLFYMDLFFANEHRYEIRYLNQRRLLWRPL